MTMELTTIPLYRLALVREPHSPLYGASTVTDSKQFYDILKPHFESLPEEEFVVLFLDAKHAPIAYQVVSRGTLTLSIVHPREVFKAACLSNAQAIICAHNHPSGNPSPSDEDRVLTKRLVRAGKLLGIRVLDHIVFGYERCYSFADQGMLT